MPGAGGRGLVAVGYVCPAVREPEEPLFLDRHDPADAIWRDDEVAPAAQDGRRRAVTPGGGGAEEAPLARREIERAADGNWRMMSWITDAGSGRLVAATSRMILRVNRSVKKNSGGTLPVGSKAADKPYPSPALGDGAREPGCSCDGSVQHSPRHGVPVRAADADA